MLRTRSRRRAASRRDLSAQCERVLEAHKLATAVEGHQERVRFGLMVCKLIEAGAPVNLRTNVGVDALSTNLLGFVQGPTGVSGYGGTASGTTATAPAATTFTTDSNNFAANSTAGMMVVTTSGANRFAFIQSNTSAANSVHTIDRWYDANALPADRGTAAASTPTAGAWVIVAGGGPAAYLALADVATAVAPAATDTALTGEVDTASNAGLIRKLATYAHTAASGGAGTTTLTKTWTANANDTLPVTVSQVGVFQGVVRTASRMFFKTALNANATLTAVSDQVAVTHTTTL